MKTILEAIKDSDEVEVDALFGLLKYSEIGIMRKLKCMALVLDLDEDQVLEEAPKDANGRILDHETRHAIHEVLLKQSQKIKK
jgi:hypothetical protein